MDMFSFCMGKNLEGEWLGHMVDMFNFVRNCQNVIQNDCTTLHYNQQYMRIPIANTWYGRF